MMYNYLLLKKGDSFDTDTQFRKNNGNWVRLSGEAIRNIRRGPNKHRTYNPSLHRQCRRILKKEEE